LASIRIFALLAASAGKGVTGMEREWGHPAFEEQLRDPDPDDDDRQGDDLPRDAPDPPPGDGQGSDPGKREKG
jgi:hypothetical protein